MFLVTSVPWEAWAFTHTSLTGFQLGHLNLSWCPPILGQRGLDLAGTYRR